jgi:hypothetical protein
VWTEDRLAVAACSSLDPDRWQDGFDELLERIGSRFVWVEPPTWFRLFLLGLLARIAAGELLDDC